MSEDQTSSKPTPENTGYTPPDEKYARWRNIFAILTGTMTDEGKEQFRKEREDLNEEADCKRCEQQRDYLLQYSSLFRYVSAKKILY